MPSRYGKSYYEEYVGEEYRELREETKQWYSEVLSLAGVQEGSGKGLDIGCAYGYSLEVLNKLGFDPFGMGVSKYAVKEGKSIYDYPIAIGNVEEKIPFSNTFSVISMVGVLEHLENPELAISNVYDKLNRGGILVASTPNPRWWRSYFGLVPENETHVNVWTPEKWENVLSNFEWRDLRVKVYQTVPILWRFLDSSLKVEFPFGEVRFLDSSLKVEFPFGEVTIIGGVK